MSPWCKLAHATPIGGKVAVGGATVTPFMWTPKLRLNPV